jgi:hypothetical protein
MTLLLLLTLAVPFADSTQTYYAAKDARALAALCADEADDAASLLCRYRLYPLTEDKAYLDDLPTEVADSASACELALLAGLWGYRAARAALPALIKYGRRSERFLQAAKALDPDDPFVLLIEGQSLLFRPSLFGGDREKALARFRTLRDVVARRSGEGVSVMEADLWTWYTLARMNHADADAHRTRLLAQDPPPLYREFLLSPP